MAFIGPALSAGSKLASSGKSGGSNPGVSPQQAALAQFQAGQQTLADASSAANSGLGDSTMNTLRQGAAGVGGALSLASMADQNAQAQNQIAQAQTANQGFGQGFNSQGNFGTSSGNFGTNSGSSSGGVSPSDPGSASGGDQVA